MWYRLFFRPFLYLLDAEFAHKLSFGCLLFVSKIPGFASLLKLLFVRKFPSLEVQVWNRTFCNPVGLAAGFDKNAEGIEALGNLGFGFIEVGTVTGEAQPGNPKPRLFRLPRDRALINRMGFNNDGAEIISNKLEALSKKRTLGNPSRPLLGVNIGKTKVVPEKQASLDYLKSTQLLSQFGDYLVVNVSSPNTPGLRNLQQIEKLKPLLLDIQKQLEEQQQENASQKRTPLLVKIAPDLSDEDVDDVAELALELGLDGIIATNTTISRESLCTPSFHVEQIGNGGLSGAPLKSRALQVLERLYRKVGKHLPLIAVGGIENAENAWERICHGASLVQVYTGFIYHGPGLPKRIIKGLDNLLKAHGYQKLQDAVGSAVTLNHENTNVE